MLEAAQTVLKDPSVLNATVFCAAAFAGQGLHHVKKWAEGEDWTMANFRRTVGALAGNVAGMLGFVATGALDDMAKIGTVIALGAFMGFSADSALNKGSRKEWTDEERKASK
jgi:hypothetical protein